MVLLPPKALRPEHLGKLIQLGIIELAGPPPLPLLSLGIFGIRFHNSILPSVVGRDTPKDTPAWSVPQTFVCPRPEGALGAPSLVVAAWAIGAGLSAIRTTAAEVKRVLLGLLARLGVDHDLA